MTYADFVKAHYKEVSHLPVKERFGAIATMWADHKAGKAVKPKKSKKVKGGMVVGGGFGDAALLAHML